MKNITSTKTLIEKIRAGESVLEYSVGENADLTLVLLSLNNKKVDSSVSVRLSGKNARATIIGIIVASKENDVKLHTMQIHYARETTSNLLVKTALYGSSRCMIDGGIKVEKDAQKTDAYQRNENLLMSETAYAESKPALEILANDVRCTHGATVGPVSADELWYLRSRGIPKGLGESLIVKGFFRSAVDLISDKKSKEDLWKSIEGAI